MTDEAMKADNHEPDYRKAMLFHSDRADQYAAERDAAVAKAPTLRAEVEKLREAAAWAMNHVSTLPMDEATQSEFMRHRAALTTEADNGLV